MWSRTPLVAALAIVAAACSEAPRDVGLPESPPELAPELVTRPLTVCADSPTTTFGIDVSKWQGTINWASVADDGVRFAFIRVSDGTGFIDARFGPNWAGAGEQGILRGAYQFFRSDEDPEEQAQIVLDHLALHGPGELPPVIDVESADGQSAATIAANVQAWIDIVEAATGQAPIIYTGRYFWDGSVDSTAFGDRDLWIAHWTSAACPGLPTGWDDWTFWQYSATGRVDGISGDVDLNRFDGTLDELEALGATDPIEPGPEPVVELTPEPVAEPVVEVSPEPAPEPAPEPGPEPTPEPDVEPTEPDVGADVWVAPDDLAAVPGSAGRSVAMTTTMGGDTGCGGGPSPWPTSLGLALVLAFIARARTRSNRQPG